MAVAGRVGRIAQHVLAARNRLRSPGMAGPLMQPCVQKSGSRPAARCPAAMLSRTVQISSKPLAATDRVGQHVGRPAGSPHAAAFQGKQPRSAPRHLVEIALFAGGQIDLFLPEPFGQFAKGQDAIDKPCVLGPVGLRLLRHARPDEYDADLSTVGHRPADVTGVGQHGRHDRHEVVRLFRTVSFHEADNGGTGRADVGSAAAGPRRPGPWPGHVIGADGRLAHVGEAQPPQGRWQPPALPGGKDGGKRRRHAGRHAHARRKKLPAPGPGRGDTISPAADTRERRCRN